MDIRTWPFWLYISIAVAFTAFPVSSKVYGSELPKPDVTYTIPKSSLIQLAWTVPFRVDGLRFEVSATKFIEGYNVATDPPLKEFSCDNENFNEGLCTISKLSSNTLYIVTVRACDAERCGEPTFLHIRTTKSYAGYVIAIILVFLLLAVLCGFVINIDLVIQMFKAGCKSRASDDESQLTPNQANIQGTNNGHIQDIPLSHVIPVSKEGNTDFRPTAPLQVKSPSPSVNSESENIGFENFYAKCQP